MTEIPLQAKYRLPKPKGKNRADQQGNGRQGPAVKRSEAYLKVLREAIKAEQARQPEIVVHYDAKGRRHVLRTCPKAAA